MTHTITQAVSRSEQQPAPSSWAKIGLVAMMLAFCPALLPVATAQCGGVAVSPRLQTVPTVPGVPTDPASVNQRLSSATTSATASIAGLWKIEFLSGGEVVDVAFDAWHSDGTEVLNDYTNPIEGNVCLGVWKQTGTRAYKLKHPSWYFDTNGNLLGTVIIHEAVHLSADGNSFYGSVVEDVYDVSGKFLYALTGKVSATRITAD